MTIPSPNPECIQSCAALFVAVPEENAAAALRKLFHVVRDGMAPELGADGAELFARRFLAAVIAEMNALVGRTVH
jgi:hypothetical protein